MKENAIIKTITFNINLDNFVLVKREDNSICLYCNNKCIYIHNKTTKELAIKELIRNNINKSTIDYFSKKLSITDIISKINKEV